MREIKQFYISRHSGGKSIHGYSYYDLFGMRKQNSLFGIKSGLFYFIPNNPSQYRYSKYIKINNVPFDDLITMEFNKNGCCYNIKYRL